MEIRTKNEARIQGNLPNTQKEGKVVIGEAVARVDRRGGSEADRQADSAKDEGK